ncbi:MAG: Asp-tRNA(Asn)/Glu-tRNA(Gln) amidotransferase subunit GatC [Myxococcota bacterium]|nr:Asp-tRNA(Asn)/Glu-tRNA(Gln) amidotransferase subunit GatC [Myxococcota bacterium]
MPRISRAEVERIASLARLSLSDAEAERMASELDTILGYVETLGEVDTAGIEPTSHVIPLATPLREDRAVPPLDPEQAVANAPAHEGTAFVVPKVIEAEDEG